MTGHGKPSGLKVLVVEDYEDTLLVLRIMLEQRGYHVLEAADGEEAVETARHECPDVILMDLSLPKLDGLAASRRIREDPRTRDVVIVAVTAHAEPQYRRHALDAGVDAFVTKPIDFKWLDDLLGSLVKGK
jgi:CheY-like chemotaxis protein